MQDSIKALLARDGRDPREAVLEALEAIQAFARAEGVPLTPELPVVHLGPTDDGTVPWCQALLPGCIPLIVINPSYESVKPTYEFVQPGQPLPRYRQWCQGCLGVYERVRGVPFPVLSPTGAR